MDLVEFKKKILDIRAITLGTKSIIPMIEKLYKDISIPVESPVIVQTAEWTSVKDRLPDKEGIYLVYAPSSDDNTPLIKTIWYDNPGWGLILAWAKSITHWMPLPETPKC